MDIVELAEKLVGAVILLKVEIDTVPIRQFLDCFHETDFFIFHEKSYGVAAGSASEAVIYLLVRCYAE